jgi:hypothetical protein
MLRALNMDGIIKDADQVQASLQTIRSFMSGIASKTLYMSKGNMKGYRTSAHVIGLMDAINLSSLSKLANEMEQKIYMNSADMMTTSSDAQNIGIVNWDDNPYRTDVNSNSWTVFFKTQDGATYPYVSILGNTNEATQSYFLTQEMFDNYKNSEAGKGSDQVRALGSDYTVPTTFPNSMISITGQPIQTIGQ